MNNPRLATRYAKSIIDLAVEQNQLDVVYADMQFILRTCKTNPDFVDILRSPIIKPNSKDKIIEAITKERISELTSSFIKLLISKARELNLPEIAEAFMDQYNVIKKIRKFKIITAVPISETLKTSILQKARGKTPLENIDLEVVVDDSLIGGFILESEGKLIDASISKDLREVSMQFFSNDYMYKIR